MRIYISICRSRVQSAGQLSHPLNQQIAKQPQQQINRSQANQSRKQEQYYDNIDKSIFPNTQPSPQHPINKNQSSKIFSHTDSLHFEPFTTFPSTGLAGLAFTGDESGVMNPESLLLMLMKKSLLISGEFYYFSSRSQIWIYFIGANYYNFINCYYCYCYSLICDPCTCWFRLSLLILLLILVGAWCGVSWWATMSQIRSTTITQTNTSSNNTIGTLIHPPKNPHKIPNFPNTLLLHSPSINKHILHPIMIPIITIPTPHHGNKLIDIGCAAQQQVDCC